MVKGTVGSIHSALDCARRSRAFRRHLVWRETSFLLSHRRRKDRSYFTFSHKRPPVHAFTTSCTTCTKFKTRACSLLNYSMDAAPGPGCKSCMALAYHGGGSSVSGNHKKKKRKKTSGSRPFWATGGLLPPVAFRLRWQTYSTRVHPPPQPRAPSPLVHMTAPPSPLSCT